MSRCTHILPKAEWPYAKRCENEAVGTDEEGDEKCEEHGGKNDGEQVSGSATNE